jgi:hypothetical protein
MLSHADRERIKADFAALEKAYGSVTDSGIQKAIRAWMEEAKKKLAEGEKKASLSDLDQTGSNLLP